MFTNKEGLLSTLCQNKSDGPLIILLSILYNNKKKTQIPHFHKTNTSLSLQIGNQNNTYCLFKLDSRLRLAFTRLLSTQTG
jgi:hypothetical protein